MKAWNEITYYGGFDWARDHHDVVIVDRRGQMVADFAIEHTAEGWQRWREQVAALEAENLAECLETSQGMVVEQLLESGVTGLSDCPGEQQSLPGAHSAQWDQDRSAGCLEFG